jgi:toxin ParE1/3/4
MPTELVWSNQARTDLLEIYVMIGLEQPAAAERYFDRIEAKAELLRSQPRMGVRRSDIRPSMRMLAILQAAQTKMLIDSRLSGRSYFYEL